MRKHLWLVAAVTGLTLSAMPSATNAQSAPATNTRPAVATNDDDAPPERRTHNAEADSVIESSSRCVVSRTARCKLNFGAPLNAPCTCVDGNGNDVRGHVG